MTKQQLTVNGKKYEVEIGDLSGSSLNVKVDGKDYTVEVESSVAAVKPVARVEKPAAAKPAATPAAAPRPAAAPAPTGSGNEVVAPMPGTILDVLVKPGDTVTKGQEVVSLEAMKMRNAIRSHKDGTISNVYVATGQKVKHNEVLVSIE